MKEFDYVIKVPNGIHAVPACQIARAAGKFISNIFVMSNDKCANATNIIDLMNLFVKTEQLVKVTVEGPDEELAFINIKKFFETKL